jgi:uncharacterized protein (TIGR02145 family)
MKSKVILILIVVVMFQMDIISQTSKGSLSQRKIALVIGNGNYTSSVLANPENDARAIADILQKLGFTVLSDLNLEQKQMKKAIDDFSLKLQNADVALFFYAGHGIQSGGYNYLIPVDANLQSEAQIEYDCVPADRVMALMDESGAQTKIMILDACRNNPFENRWARAAAGKGLASMKAPKNTFIAYSTAPGSTASDGSGRNSIYTSALLESLIIPDLTIDQMFQNVGRIVSQKSGGQQIPWKSSSLIFDFYFNREKGTNPELEEVDYNLDPRDNKNYMTVKIGKQIWMKNNLSYISFNNGDSIPEIKDLNLWNSVTSSALCSYNNNPSYSAKYGRLYNFYAASDIRNLCPAGWHLPTNNDWDSLAKELGGILTAGGKMKEKGAGSWISPNIDATNESGFSAVPSGFREAGSDFKNIGAFAGFYSVEGNVKFLTSSTASIESKDKYSPSEGYSIRCIKGRNALVETDSASVITSSTTTLNGKVNPNIAFTIVSFEFGLTESYDMSMQAVQSPVAGSVPVLIRADITNLKPGTTYHFRTKAENIAGVTYGTDQIFTTLVPPDVSTSDATSITASAANLNGTVNANNLLAIVSFEYGTTPGYGQIVTVSRSPISGNEKINISSGLTGLKESTLYHFRVKAQSLAGTSIGNDLTFTTLTLPHAKTDSAYAVTSSSVSLRGKVNSSNLSTTVLFEYGLTKEYGDSIKVENSPFTGISDKLAIASVTGLTPGSTYHYRVKATSQAGMTYGGDLTFTTPLVVKDIIGNIYNTVTIGNQEWMAENLRTTRFNDGAVIPILIDEKKWSRSKKPAYCWYNNDSTSNKVPYGALYNWYAVNTYKLCPTGWHVPSNAEWNTFIYYLGGASQSGNKLKEAGIAHWREPNTEATNESGFAALPGGSRDFIGKFSYYGFKTQWWSANDTISKSAWCWGVDFINSGAIKFYPNKTEGLSVRCVMEKIEVPVSRDTTIVNMANYFIDPRDNRRYEISIFHNQTWMRDNLKATRFNDSTEIPLVIDKIAWTRLESPAYCWYDNQEAYSTYGALYNWHAINSGKLCPVGWHMPSDEEWTTLVDFSLGAEIAGGYLKEPGTKHWDKPNMGFPHNDYFKALPGGLRDENGEFINIGKDGYWWSYLKNFKPAGWYRSMHFSSLAVYNRNFKNKPIGISVRCIKD